MTGSTVIPASGGDSDAPPLASLHHISCAFAGIPVLDDVSLTVRGGRVTALVGENGAGKSTLMNVLGGTVAPTSGVMHLAGQPYAPATAAVAARAGVAFVHQEPLLFPNLTIAENLQLTAFPRSRLRLSIDTRALRARAAALLARVGLDRDPDSRVERLSAGERQLVEIARALGVDPRVIIFDEPTTSLTAPERDRLFTLMRELKAAGLALIFISHHLEDVLRECQDVVVLRDGRVVAAGPTGEFTIDRLVTLMVGRDVGAAPHAPRSPAGAPVLELRGVDQPGIVRDVNLVVGAGEIVGVSGLMGAGRTELARIIAGLDPMSGGAVLLDQRPLVGSPSARVRQGLGFVTEDRRDDGLCLDATWEENLALAALRAFCRTPLRLLDRGRLTAATETLGRSLALTRVRPGAPVRFLSGGNQQKIAVGKWLLASPRVLLIDEPTRGVDVAARAEIHRLLRQLAAGGAGLLVVSSDLEELLALCDRIVVMRQGELAASVTRDAFDRDRLMAQALPAGRSR